MISLLASAKIDLMPNMTIIPQLGIFLTVVFVLKKFVLTPTMLILNRRKELTDGASSEAAKLNEHADLLDQKIVDRLEQERLAQAKIEEERRAKSANNASEIVEQARSKSSSEISAKRAEIFATQQKNTQALQGEISAMKDLIVQRVTDGNDKGAKL
tara:strand:+ start:249 stop:719 length:471 start_codon:yes stop_codon:yes gene_type:complete